MSNSLLLRALHALASACYPQDNGCHACGQPMLRAGEHLLCARCQGHLAADALSPEEQPFFLEELIPFSFAAYRHDGVARKLVHRLKYGGDHWVCLPLAEGMAGLAANVAHEALRQTDLLAPIPLHPKRERWRGYNQALLLARQVAFHTGLPLCPEALRRIRYTRSQVGGGRAQRRRNMLGAFEVTDPAPVYGRRVLLVDDVCTTGATAVACAQALRACGAKDVMLLTACKA